MKIRINQQGNLEIFRTPDYRQVFCPKAPFQKIQQDKFTQNYRYCYCGDWCALFHEPHYIDKNTKVIIQLCETTYTVEKENFEDLRSERKHF